MFVVMKNKKQSCPHNLTVADLARVAQILKLLAHPHRLEIIDILESEIEAPVHVLVERLNLPQSATSNHLNLMRRAGLVDSVRRGKEVWYSLGDRRCLTILNCMRAKKEN
jgi:DNA-binding transcriptional ArsR family regulator